MILKLHRGPTCLSRANKWFTTILKTPSSIPGFSGNLEPPGTGLFLVGRRSWEMSNAWLDAPTTALHACKNLGRLAYRVMEISTSACVNRGYFGGVFTLCVSPTG